MYHPQMFPHFVELDILNMPVLKLVFIIFSYWDVFGYWDINDMFWCIFQTMQAIY